MDIAAITRGHLRKLRGNRAIITRGEESCSGVIVILARTDMLVVTNRDVRIEAKAQDILICAADYAPTGEASEPADNDRITVLIDGASIKFDVRPPANGQRCFNYSNPEATEFRVHAKRVT